jgi:NitT/TauT family transport system substrate-binding protein
MRTTSRIIQSLVVAGLLAACGAPARPNAPAGAATPASGAPAAPAASAPTLPAASSAGGPAAANHAAAAAPTAALAGASAGREVARPLDPRQRVRIADTGLAAQGPTYLAVEHGYFREMGFDVEVVSGVTTNDMVTLLSSDQLDVGLQAISPAFYNVVARGVGIRLVADHGTLIPGRTTVSLAVRTDILERKPWTGYADLKGLKIGSNQAGSLGSYYRELILQRGGLTSADIEVIEPLPFPDMALAFANKAIEAGQYNEPWATLQEEQGIVKKVAYMDAVEPNGHIAGLLYGEPFARNTAAARNFMVGYLRGIRHYWDAYDGRQDFQDVVDALKKYTPLKDETIIRKVPQTGQNPNGYLDPAKVAFYQDWFADHGLVTQKADVTKALDHTFLDYANAVLGPYEPVANPRRVN